MNSTIKNKRVKNFSISGHLTVPEGAANGSGVIGGATSSTISNIYSTLDIEAGGNVVEYGKRLTERQDAEIAIYERAKADMERAKETMNGSALIAFWEEQNDKLRILGIRPITLESLE